ncbi:MAG: TonB-dependent receptor [Alistipes sp.]|nr:TonB-dependent receptor [Alistipes senegalensis]MCM1249975.1 TonB-dependent receptor [Alistipes sp.]
MKRYLLPIAALALSAAAQAGNLFDSRSGRSPELSESPAPGAGETSPEDSVRMFHLQEIEVTATRATDRTPVAFSQLAREEIARNSFGCDIPSVLALAPSVVATNETGIGIGGTSVRLRGTDASRLSVTINGVSLNNPDSHSMYWYDTPDLISAVGDMQIQRGAGISTNGTGAFGGAVNMTTEALSTEFGGSASLSYGSYNTNKQAVQLSSGLLGGHWALDARLTHIGSDGYIDRGATDLKSYMFQAGYYGGNTMLKLVSFGGKSRTYLTYNGVSKEEMALYGRRYHTGGQYYTSDGPHVLADGSHVDYYDDQTDNYLQINNQLLLSHRFDDRWTMNATAFYTYGYGYYKQYKDDAWIMGYDNLEGPEQADLIREKIMRNHLGGLHAAAHYASQRLELSFGGSYSYYSCPHWGTLDWVDGMDPSAIGGRWYDNDVDKHDANLFARANWTVARGLGLFADLQYRYVSYKAWGTNDNYDWNRYEMQPIDVDRQYRFFNPHVGLNYTRGRHSLYASFAVAQKEPTRNDFTDRYMFSGDEAYPSFERLYDYELGYNYRSPRLAAGINLYYMDYKDQLVPTGMVNDGGDALNINIPESYRCGVELSASWQATRWFSFGGNATWSRNKLRHFVDRLADSPTFGQDLGTRTLSYSPDWIAGAFLDFHARGFEAVLRTRYVGKQYFTNEQIDALSMEAYCVSDLHLGYTLRTARSRSVRFGVIVYNLFDAEYESNGYGYSYFDKDDNGAPKRVDAAYYFPQAPLHVLANVTISF